MERSSEYLSCLTFQDDLIRSVNSESVAPDRIGVFKSMPPVANKQVTSFPSVLRRALEHWEQKGFVTEEMSPISPEASEYSYLSATSSG